MGRDAPKSLTPVHRINNHLLNAYQTNGFVLVREKTTGRFVQLHVTCNSYEGPDAYREVSKHPRCCRLQPDEEDVPASLRGFLYHPRRSRNLAAVLSQGLTSLNLSWWSLTLQLPCA